MQVSECFELCCILCTIKPVLHDLHMCNGERCIQSLSRPTVSGALQQLESVCWPVCARTYHCLGGFHALTVKEPYPGLSGSRQLYYI